MRLRADRLIGRAAVHRWSAPRPALETGMMAATLNHEERAEVGRRAWELRQAGLTVREIAGVLDVHHSTVVRVLARVEARVLERLEDEVEAEKRRQIAELRGLYAALVAAWDLTLEDAEAESVTTGKQAVDPKQGRLFDLRPEVKTEKRGQAGNPAHLTAAMGALDRLRSILGLDAPPKRAGEGVEGEPCLVIAVDVERV